MAGIWDESEGEKRAKAFEGAAPRTRREPPCSTVSRCQYRIVIPGRCEASNPESRDSGSGANAPSRNDGLSYFLVKLRRQDRAPDQPALLQIDQRFIGLGERHRRYGNGRDLPGAYEIQQFLRLPEIADIAALDRDRLDRN